MMQVVVQAPPTPAPPPWGPPFDPNLFFIEAAPLLGLIAVALAAAFVLKALFRSPIGDAIAEGIRERRKRRRHWRGHGTEWIDEPAEGETGRVVALEQEVGRLRGELAELAERVDFAERLLAERREPKLGAGR